MNAAARLAHQNVLSRHVALTHLITRSQLAIMLMSLGVLMSALSVIYVTQTTRMLYATYQHNLAEQDHLHVQRGQLLLERSTWLMQSRVQNIAADKMGMVVPNAKSVVIVHE
jgi:cell division protein FtsL